MMKPGSRTRKPLYLVACFVFYFLVIQAKCGVDGKTMTACLMQQELENIHVIPEVIPEGPRHYLSVEWIHGIRAEFGNIIEPGDCKTKPILIKWDWEENKYYTLIFVDVDKKNEGVSCDAYLHWLCVNIEGPEVLQGLNVADYHPPKPAEGSGVHRFVWLLYEQPKGRQYFEFSPIKDTLEHPSSRRANFSVADFAKTNHLGRVLAANVFYAVYFPPRIVH